MIVKTVGGTKRRIFVSFDTCSDQHHRDFFLSQGRKSDATWHVSFTSEPFEEPTVPWVAATLDRISRCEALVVILSPITFSSAGVLKEIQLAQVLGKPIYQIVPYGVAEPHVIPDTGRIVPWDWDAVRRTLATIPRHWGSRVMFWGNEKKRATPVRVLAGMAI